MSYAVMPLTDYRDMCDKVREKIVVNLLENATFEIREINEEHHDIFLCSTPFHLEDDVVYTLDFPNADDNSTNLIYIAAAEWNTSNYGTGSILVSDLPNSFSPSELQDAYGNFIPESKEYRIFIGGNNSTNISDYIDTTGATLVKVDNTIKSGEMPSKIEEVYEAGKAVGGDTEAAYNEGLEAGKQAEYDKLWDNLQNNGNAMNYYYKFAYAGWNDKNFNPKYPIVCSTGTTTAMNMFYHNTGIIDTKVPIIVNGSNAGSIFNNASNLVTIRCLNVHEGVAFSSTFLYCNNLKNITFEGVIGQDISFNSSPYLTDDSINSIIEHLKPLTSGTKTLTVASAVYNRMVADGRDALVTAKNWTLVSA